MTTGSCDSCGREEPAEELISVRRVYIRAESWRDVPEAVDEGDIDVRGDVECWCFACRSQYPHQPVDP
ncbi:MAG TPA: hypothetical protein VGA13_01795 [Acidimicrobiales bacterium]